MFRKNLQKVVDCNLVVVVGYLYADLLAMHALPYGTGTNKEQRTKLKLQTTNNLKLHFFCLLMQIFALYFYKIKKASNILYMCVHLLCTSVH